MQEGFDTYIQDPVWLAKARRGDYFVDLITGVGNATLTVEQEWIDRAQEDEVLGIRCKVLPAEEMIASKLFVTRRERFDGADIAHLLKACARTLDWDRLRKLTESHWQMLYWQLVLFAYIYPAHAEVMSRQPRGAILAERLQKFPTTPQSHLCPFAERWSIPACSPSM